MSITTIPISKKFHDWLKSKGMKGESYENVIKKLLKPEFQQELADSEDSHDISSDEKHAHESSSGGEHSHESSSDEVGPF